MTRRRYPWDGPNPDPGDYLAGRTPGQAWLIAAVEPLRHEDQFGARLVLNVVPVLPESIPDHATIHPAYRAAYHQIAGPPRVRQLHTGPSGVIRADWRDPDDHRPHARLAREISGWRAYDPVAQLVDAGHAQPHHAIAAALLRREAALAVCGYGGSALWEGAVHGLPRPPSGPGDGAIAQAMASIAVERALARFWPEQRLMICAVVIMCETLPAWCRRFTPVRPSKPERGKLLTCLDVLVDHYRSEIDAALRRGDVAA